MISRSVHTVLYTVSTLVLLVALLLIIVFEIHWARFLYIAGAMGYLFAVVWYRPQKRSIRLNRLIRMAHFAGLLWTASAIAYTMNSKLWAVFAGIAVLFMLYSNIAITFNKENKPTQDEK